MIGIAIAAQAPAEILKATFVVSALLMAAQLAFKHTTAVEDPKLPPRSIAAPYGLMTGIISTLVGIGGGAYISGLMTYYGWSIHRAVGTASTFGPVIALPAVAGYLVSGWNQSGLPPLSVGYVSLFGVAIIAPVSVLTAPVGVRIAHSLSRKTLERIFIAFLLLVALRFAVSLYWPS
jgi:uncharacterized membrane protein YfcA